jgi:2-dehydropantoate 2-reductase
MNDPAILIVGAGAMGGTIGAHLARGGHEVVLVDRVPEHLARMREAGLTITGPLAKFEVPVKVRAAEELDGQYGRVLLCVKAQDTEAATRMLAPHLAPDGYVVSVQNGLNEYAIAAIVGEQRTIGCFVNFGADYLSPGVIHYAGHGAVVVGELNGAITDRLRALRRVLLAFDRQARLTDNIWGFLWSKEAYAALLFATALTNESIADCLARERHRKLFTALAREVMHVAAAKRVRCEAFDGFQPAATCMTSRARAVNSFRCRSRARQSANDGTDEEAADSLAALVAHNRRSAKSHSGIWRDLAVRKRRTEVDSQLGVIVQEAKACGIEVPLVERLIDLIHEIENGTRPQDIGSLEALAEVVYQ